MNTSPSLYERCLDVIRNGGATYDIDECVKDLEAAIAEQALQTLADEGQKLGLYEQAEPSAIERDTKCLPDGFRYKLPPLMLSKAQLREALDVTDDEDQRICIALRTSGRDVDGEVSGAGLTCWVQDSPEEGSILLLGIAEQAKPIHTSKIYPDDGGVTVVYGDDESPSTLANWAAYVEEDDALTEFEKGYESARAWVKMLLGAEQAKPQEPVAWTDENVIAWCLRRGIEAAKDTPALEPMSEDEVRKMSNAALDTVPKHMPTSEHHFGLTFMAGFKYGVRAIEAHHIGVKK